MFDLSTIISGTTAVTDAALAIVDPSTFFGGVIAAMVVLGILFMAAKKFKSLAR